MTDLKLFIISFEGHYPIGAYAAILASTEREARELFTVKLAEEEPYLTKAKIYEALELPLKQGVFHLISNGNY